MRVNPISGPRVLKPPAHMFRSIQRAMLRLACLVEPIAVRLNSGSGIMSRCRDPRQTESGLVSRGTTQLIRGRAW